MYHRNIMIVPNITIDLEKFVDSLSPIWDDELGNDPLDMDDTETLAECLKVSIQNRLDERNGNWAKYDKPHSMPDYCENFYKDRW